MTLQPSFEVTPKRKAVGSNPAEDARKNAVKPCAIRVRGVFVFSEHSAKPAKAHLLLVVAIPAYKIGPYFERCSEVPQKKSAEKPVLPMKTGFLLISCFAIYQFLLINRADVMILIQ